MTVAYDGPVIDAGIHHQWASQLELVEYLPTEWREYLGKPDSLPGGVGMMPAVPRGAYESPLGDYLENEDGDQGRVPGSDPELVRTHIRATSITSRAILAFGPGTSVAAHPNQYLSLELVKAANNWSIDKWLGLPKDVLYGLIMVPSPMPEAAAAEVRRVGVHERVAGALMCANNIGKPYGHSIYHPIYEAAVEMDLPIIIHSDGTTADAITQPTGGGQPATFAEYHLFQCQVLMTHVVSLISQGVFERYPRLRVVLSGAGVNWITTFLWRFDNDYVALRREVPWMKRMPTDCFREHFRVLTHPFDKGPSPATLLRLFGSFGGAEDLLCFSSGYPNWDSDTFEDVRSWLPVEWHHKVFHDNAAATFRWERADSTRAADAVGRGDRGTEPEPSGGRRQ
jgi:uncharacterized protein